MAYHFEEYIRFHMLMRICDARAGLYAAHIVYLSSPCVREPRPHADDMTYTDTIQFHEPSTLLYSLIFGEAMAVLQLSSLGLINQNLGTIDRYEM